jgi:hypothetical protein
MKSRCYNEKDPAFSNYGYRGIRVHPAWIRSYRAFATFMGPKPSPEHSIDRINTNGNYEPGNVRWATDKEQANNMRTNVWLQWNGETITLTQLAEREQVNYDMLHRRIRKLMLSPEEAVASVKKMGKVFIPDKRLVSNRKPKYPDDFC